VLAALASFSVFSACVLVASAIFFEASAWLLAASAWAFAATAKSNYRHPSANVYPLFSALQSFHSALPFFGD